MQSVKQAHLLRLIWSSPIFGDAFPRSVFTRLLAVLSQTEDIYLRATESLEPILVQAMPQTDPTVMGKLVRRILSQTAAFCSAIAANEISDTELLRSGVMNITLVHWADQSMDQGDEATLAAVRLLDDGHFAEAPIPAETHPPAIQARLAALTRIRREAEKLGLPEDVPLLLRCAVQETLHQEARKRELNRLYSLQAGPDFWAAHTPEMVDTLLATSGMIHCVANLYVAYRQSRPDLPTLSEIFNQTVIMEVLRGPYNAAIRVVDDLSDRSKDGRHDPGQGEFNLNIFNQPQPDFVYTFARHAGLKEEAIITSVFEAFRSGTEDGRAYIVQVFLELIRDRMRALPEPLWQDYGVFLTVAKRTLEAAYVHFSDQL